MKNKIFWNSFFIFLFFSISLFVVDRIYMFRQADEKIRHDLQSIASVIIASELSVDVLQNFEAIDDIIRDLLEDQRLDRTIRVFNPQKHLLFQNEMAHAIVGGPSSNLWSEVQISERHLKRLTLITTHYTLEVGLFTEPMLSQLATHGRQIAFILTLILLISLVISYFSVRTLMAPMTKLGQFFMFYNSHRSVDQQTLELTEKDRDFLKLMSAAGGEVSQLAHGLLTYLERVRHEQEKRQRDLYFLAHELKTPLAHLVFGLENLKQNISEAPQTAQLNRLMEVCKNLSEFIKDYLRVASVQNQSKSSMQISAIRVGQIIEKMMAQFDFVSQKRIKIVIKENLTVFAEPVLLESLLQNLISNALKYSTGDVLIEVESSRINIIDSGEGFNEKSLLQMGRPFNRSDTEESTGLGLTYCFEICHLFKWQLIHSRKDNKTIMTIQFDSESLT